MPCQRGKTQCPSEKRDKKTETPTHIPIPRLEARRQITPRREQIRRPDLGQPGIAEVLHQSQAQAAAGRIARDDDILRSDAEICGRVLGW